MFSFFGVDNVCFHGRALEKNLYTARISTGGGQMQW